MFPKRLQETHGAVPEVLEPPPAPMPVGVAEALALIDRDLATMTHRQIVPADEVCDLLLDLRSVLLLADSEAPGRVVAIGA
jgi:hypothetical protein